jgi:hypothetical protein
MKLTEQHETLLRFLGWTKVERATTMNGNMEFKWKEVK